MKRYKVEFIGSGWECIAFITVMANSPMDACRMAEDIHKSKWKWKYCEIEATEI